jgi:hypothetical protein
MGRMSPQEVERRLGEQYANALKENPQFASVYKDCKDVIEASLSVMDHYNRMALNIQTMGRRVSASANASFSNRRYHLL